MREVLQVIGRSAVLGGTGRAVKVRRPLPRPHAHSSACWQQQQQQQLTALTALQPTAPKR